jgi:hypothetical protein
VKIEALATARRGTLGRDRWPIFHWRLAARTHWLPAVLLRNLITGHSVLSVNGHLPAIGDPDQGS